jgi:hypothetical protein
LHGPSEAALDKAFVAPFLPPFVKDLAKCVELVRHSSPRQWINDESGAYAYRTVSAQAYAKRRFDES